MKSFRTGAAVFVLLGLLLPAVPAAAAEWEDAFDPFTVRTFNLQLTPQNWDTIRKDTTNEIEVPAQFWADDETPLLVSVRRKSSRALPSESNPIKVGLKVDFDEFVDDQEWHGLLKLSLENGADSGVVEEGYLWNLHQQASDSYGYQPGHANWARLNVNGTYIGVYANVEQIDRRMLENRGVFTRGSTWLYEQDDRSGPVLESGSGVSPGLTHLCYSPFVVNDKKTGVTACPTPSDAALDDDLESWVTMSGMLTLGAVDAFAANHDNLIAHGKNFSFADFGFVTDPDTGNPVLAHKRMYFPWDLDTAFKSTTASIYARGSGRKLTQEPYQRILLNHPVYRQQYNATMTTLFADGGVLDEASQHAFLDQLEATLAGHLAADPYPTSEGGAFDRMRSFVSARTDNVAAQVTANGPPPPRS